MPHPPPPRKWVPLDREHFQNPDRTSALFRCLNIANMIALDSGITLRVMNYNILCTQYATTQMYGYCPTWALDWKYRRELIAQEIERYDPDVLCLQVESALFSL